MLGEKLYYTGANQSFDNGDRVVHGEQGEVMGPGNAVRLRIQFPNNKGNVGCLLASVSRSPPTTRRLAPAPLPGGFDANILRKFAHVQLNCLYEDGDLEAAKILMTQRGSTLASRSTERFIEYID